MQGGWLLGGHWNGFEIQVSGQLREPREVRDERELVYESEIPFMEIFA